VLAVAYIIIFSIAIALVFGIILSLIFFVALKPKIRKNQGLKESKESVNRVVEETRQKTNRATEEAKQPKKSEKAGRNGEKATSAANIIPQDNKELLSGAVTLMINPGVQSSKILYLTNSLCEKSDIHIFSTGGIAGKGSYVGLLIQKPVPLFQLLYNIAVVQQVTRKGNEIRITINNNEYMKTP
jgi:hypothetical protein